MIICPVCEHPQASGLECDQCGKVLAVAAAPAVAAVARLPELEANALEGSAVAKILRVQSISELEVNRLPSGPDLPSAPLAELDRSRAEPVGEVGRERMAELDPGREKDTEPRTVAPTGAVTCRYCRAVQAEGMLCEKCGMRLPRARPAVAAAGSKKTEEGVWTRCKSCGAPGQAGRACGDCGREVAFPES